ncbi:cytosolic protein [Candidatus Poribacteria bacterium]|nr:cytosolic protein [Candidatus Poribacteria bacterium]MYG07570.1 cytosolic protein [Candidatus Poribacteria bacterium]MYK23282.1 cytosolic protein [Candidatus Poribacteria bacterium]
MKPITQQEITDYIETNIQDFHQRRLDKLQKLKLLDVVKRKNPYLFKTKNIRTVPEFIKTILDAHLSSQEETIFGKFLEELAIFICSQVYGGKKSAAEGIDLEFERDNIRYIVSIKSGPNWGNSSQVKKLRDNFRKAKRILHTNISSTNVVAVNGCCYGKDRKPDKGEYLKLCGQKFWEFISGDHNLYTDIIEPLGHQAKEKKEQFREEYDKAINRLIFEFIPRFCDTEGNILWAEIVKFNSANTTS